MVRQRRMTAAGRRKTGCNSCTDEGGQGGDGRQMRLGKVGYREGGQMGRRRRWKVWNEQRGQVVGA